MLLYYITNRTQFLGDESRRRARLLTKISEAARAGIDYIQLREMDLSSCELELLSRKVVRLIRESGSRTRLLINSRSDIALATGADGVHLRSNDISPDEVKTIWQKASGSAPVIAVSCHNEEEVIAAQSSAADFVVFGPAFEKKDSTVAANGIDQLRGIARHKIPVLALGGITLQNAASCVAAGASGIAAIRLFQENEISVVVKTLRSAI